MTIFWRFVFFLAVLGNLLFFAWSQGYFGRVEDGREPQRIGHQLEPDKLRVTEVPPAPPPTAETCRLIGGLALADARRLQDKVASAEAANGLKFALKPLDLPPGYWVFIPPLANKALADRKQLELKQRGVADSELILADGADKLAISLGMFNTEEEAAARLEALTKRGVRSAIVQARTRPADKAQVEARGPQDALLKQIPELLNGLGLSNTSIEDCPNEK